jgi:[acyl-carrier-protein] S-malonyltransferase
MTAPSPSHEEEAFAESASYVFLFPGQNSRYPAMIERLRDATPLADITLREASDVLGRDLHAQYRADNPAIFARNRDVQVGVYIANYILARFLEAEGIRSIASAGLSLGEYNHLTEIGALSLPAALLLLEARGDAYDAAPSGRMVAVFPCSASDVAAAVAHARGHGSIDVCIELGERNFVLGGEAEALDAAVAWLEDEAYAQARLVDAALPMHASLFRPAAEAFLPALERAEWSATTASYLPNVDGALVENPDPPAIVDRLHRHIFSTVRWTQTVALLASRHPRAIFVEVGSRRVLSDLLVREHKHLHVHHMDEDPDPIRLPPRS